MFKEKYNRDEEYFEQEEFWNRKLEDDPNYMEKINIFLEIIPDDTETILDVGCGNGAITNILSKRYNVVGFDRSKEALKHVNTKTVQGSCDNLPFEDNAFDMVLCSEVLEHLPTDILNKTVSEIKRVSKKYILISVPYKEQLQLYFIKCPKCGTISHVYGHLHSFDENLLKNMFADCDLIYETLCGAMMPPDYPSFLLKFRQKILGVYWDATPNYYPMCPNCKNTDYRIKHPWLDKIFRLGTYAIFRVVTFNKPKHPDWIVALFKHKDKK